MLLGELLEAPGLPRLELQGKVDALREALAGKEGISLPWSMQGAQGWEEPRFGGAPAVPAGTPAPGVLH